MNNEKTDFMSLLFETPPVLKGRSLVLKPLAPKDTEALRRLTREEAVYRYLPSFLFEKQDEPENILPRLYKEGLRDSLILGVFQEDLFRGLAEVYGYRAPIHKASVGYRLMREAWGKGIATEALGILVEELTANRGIEILTASTMIGNRASARVLEKNGFTLVCHKVYEDWGFSHPILADKWIR